MDSVVCAEVVVVVGNILNSDPLYNAFIDSATPVTGVFDHLDIG